MKTFDPRCLELARIFLANGSEVSLHSLASDIQGAIEDWMDDAPGRFLLDNEDSVPCGTCGSEERDRRGILRCECPNYKVPHGTGVGL